MRLIVYAVIYSLVDDIMQNELDNIYPTKESAIRAAQKIGRQSNCYEVQVDKDEVTEEYGRHWLSTVYSEKHHERYDEHYL